MVGEGTRASNREARRILAEAVAKDPGYAPAQVALGRALLEYALNGWTEFPEDAIAEAERAAHAALALDPDLASANRLLGDIFMTPASSSIWRWRSSTGRSRPIRATPGATSRGATR